MINDFVDLFKLLLCEVPVIRIDSVADSGKEGFVIARPENDQQQID